MAENPWQWWQDRLAGRPTQIDPSTPRAGFYRMSSKAVYGARKTFKPVAYWPNGNGSLNCRVGDENISFQRGEELWPYVANNPVSEDAYRKVAEGNEAWPDEHLLVPMGDNLPPADDSWEGLRDAVIPLAEDAERRLKGGPVEDQDEADRYGNLADRLQELAKLIKAAKDAERKPHDEALVTIQKRWAPLELMSESYKNLKYKLLQPWASQEDARKRAEAEAAVAAGEPVSPESARRTRVGTRGRAMTLRKTKHAEITDYAMCLAHFAQSEDVKSLIQTLANRAVRAGFEVPGAKLIEEEKLV